MSRENKEEKKKKSRHIADFGEHYVSAASLEKFDQVEISYNEWKAIKAPDGIARILSERNRIVNTPRIFITVGMRAEEEKEGVIFSVYQKTSDGSVNVVFEHFEPDENGVAKVIYQAIAINCNELFECTEFMKYIQKTEERFIEYQFYHKNIIVNDTRIFGIGKICSKNCSNTLLVFDSILFYNGIGVAQNIVGSNIDIANIKNPVIFFTDCEGRRFTISNPVKADKIKEGNTESTAQISFYLPDPVRIEQADSDEETAKAVPPTLDSLGRNWEEYARLHQPYINARKKTTSKQSRFHGFAV